MWLWAKKAEAGQVLVRTIKSEVIQIELSRELGVKIKDVAKYLLKKKGDKVQAGEILAKNKTLLSTKILKSPLGGEIIHFNTDEGTLSLAVVSQIKELKSLVKGEIVDKSNTEITIKYEGEEFNGHKGKGEKAGVLQMVKDRAEIVDFFGLTKELSNSIILGMVWTKEALAKAIALDCGMIGLEFPGEFETESSINQNNFGILEIDKSTFDKLKNLVHKKVFLSGDLKKIIYQP